MVLVALLAGCTFVGGVAGGSIASRRNHHEELERARSGEPEVSTSILPGVLTGAGIGMFLDAVAIGFLLDQGRTEPLPAITR